MELILIRHGETDYSTINKDENLNIWKNFANLSELGKQQALEISQDKLLSEAELILTSPYTRAIETASIISKQLNLPIEVEFDLSEWDHEICKQFDKVLFYEMLNEMKRSKGIHNEKCKYKWESLNELGERVFNVIKKYNNYNKVIVVTHIMVINQFLYKDNIKNCEIIKLKFDTETKPTGFLEL